MRKEQKSIECENRILDRVNEIEEEEENVNLHRSGTSSVDFGRQAYA